ncbi:MAG: hypothetical protein HYW26_03870 [Candidatus Aenigmarchaeota archaeon]|nr:hypothetical protein [Candidatus Aenigmarchaeota archaeon]
MIELTAKRILDPELSEKLPDYGELLRILCFVKFKTSENWSQAYQGIVDTGAHTSVIPHSIWKGVEHETIGEHYVKGIVPENRMPVKVGLLQCVLLDRKGNFSKPIKIRAFLAPADDIPLIMGFKDILENFEIRINLRNGSYLMEL